MAQNKEDRFASWEWECLGYIFDARDYSVVESGPLFGPVRSFELVRDKKMKLHLTTTSGEGASAPERDWIKGEIRNNTDAVKLEGIDKSEITFSGVTSYSHNVSHSIRSGFVDETSIERSHVNSIRGVLSKNEPEFVIDWIANLDHSNILWPDSIDGNKTISKTRNWNFGGASFEVSAKSEITNFGRSCVNINIDGIDISLGTCKDTVSEAPRPGYILYRANINEDIKRKIRDCISFVLGNYLVYLGCSLFRLNGEFVGFYAVNGQSMGEKAIESHALPPIPLGAKYQNELNSQIFSRAVSALYSAYDEYSFIHIFWAYWHARFAPYHIAAVHFGAAIESLQKKYIDSHGKTEISKIFETRLWRVIREKITKTLDGLDIPEDSLELLTSQVNNLNRAPQRVITDRFLQHIGITLGNMELKAWQQRNNAAHGNIIEEGEFINAIQENKLLMLIFHRMILKITNAADCYVDYHSLHFPEKLIEEPSA